MSFIINYSKENNSYKLWNLKIKNNFLKSIYLNCLVFIDKMIDIKVMLHIVINLLKIEILKAIKVGTPSRWRSIVEVASLTPSPPGKPDNTPARPENKYILIAFACDIESVERI